MQNAQRSAIVTGANHGIGLEGGRQLARCQSCQHKGLWQEQSIKR
ncbi:MAG TPA: hypothetical protein V6C65_40675 [Allocoleopsis sp.]